MNIIKCPKCGREYLLSEIFYPDEFFGHPSNIIKDEEGKIIHIKGKDMNLTETYSCDSCGCEFKVEVSLSTKVEENKDIVDFDVEYTSKID